MTSNNTFQVTLVHDKAPRDVTMLWYKTIISIPRSKYTKSLIRTARLEYKSYCTGRMRYQVKAKDMQSCNLTIIGSVINQTKDYLFMRRRHIQRIRHDRKAVYSDGGIRHRPGTILELLYRKQTRDIYSNKTPGSDDKSNYIGVEIEFLSKHNCDVIAKRLLDAGLKMSVCLKDDGSLRNTDQYQFTHEVVILGRQGAEITDLVNKTCAVIQDGGAINKSCGLH